jgi:hypothetical protein
MTLPIKYLPDGRIPKGMIKVTWILQSARKIETAEINDIRRVRQAQFVVPGEGVYNVTSVRRFGDSLVAHCWPVAKAGMA